VETRDLVQQECKHIYGLTRVFTPGIWGAEGSWTIEELYTPIFNLHYITCYKFCPECGKELNGT